MSEHAGNGPDRRALEMRLSVPTQGDLRGVVRDLTVKIAEHLGAASSEAESLCAEVEGLASRVCNGADEDVTFDFRQESHELVVEARCEGETSEVRHRLPG